MNFIRSLPGFASNQTHITLCLSANWRQIALLVAANMFLGGMLGMELPILPGLADA